MIESFDSERLTLRPVVLDDVENLLHLDADPEVMRFITGGRPSTREEVTAVVRAEVGHRWIAHETASGELVGWFGMRRPDDRPGEGELGYRLHRRAWGRGYATEGARRLIDLAFADLGLRRVWAETMAVNAASRRVMERCGMTHVRTFHLEWDDPIPGTEHGEVEYEILVS